MHVFLQGPRNIGKSMVILRALELLAMRKPLALGGFFTWKGGEGDPHVYMRAAGLNGDGEKFRLARWDPGAGRLVCDIRVFEEIGAGILSQREGADLIIMDELGRLESDAQVFKQAVLDTLAGGIPVLGTLRIGDIPWHASIKRNPRVALINVNEENRNALPYELLPLFASVQGLSENWDLP